MEIGDLRIRARLLKGALCSEEKLQGKHVENWKLWAARAIAESISFSSLSLSSIFHFVLSCALSFLFLSSLYSHSSSLSPFFPLYVRLSLSLSMRFSSFYLFTSLINFMAFFFHSLLVSLLYCYCFSFSLSLFFFSFCPHSRCLSRFSPISLVLLDVFRSLVISFFLLFYFSLHFYVSRLSLSLVYISLSLSLIRTRTHTHPLSHFIVNRPWKIEGFVCSLFHLRIYSCIHGTALRAVRISVIPWSVSANPLYAASQ